MAIADVYDALISERVYKKAFTHDDAVNLIRSGHGTHFDPDVCDAFNDLSDQFREIAKRYADPQADLDAQRERLRLVFGHD